MTLTKADAKVTEREKLVSGQVNMVSVKFTFTDDWNDLKRFAVFTSGEVTKTYELDETNVCFVPAEVTLKCGLAVRCGVYGTKDGVLVIPSVYVLLGIVEQGAEPDNDETVKTPGVIEQVFARFESVSKTADEAKKAADDVVERADNGEFNGKDGYTPQKGIDYFTEADVAEVEKNVMESVDKVLEESSDAVYPEWFGAVADGVTDDSKAIQDAINTSRRVELRGVYRIDKPINIKKDSQIITINGRLVVNCDVGIELTGSWNTINGGGVIEVISASGSAVRRAIRILVTDGQKRGNVISVRKIFSRTRHNHNIGIEITGNEVSGGCCYDRITSDIEFFEYGIWCHKSVGQSDSTWYTNLYVDSSITGCIQAVVFDDTGVFNCEGSFIKGAIQPFRTDEFGSGGGLLEEEVVAKRPLVKIIKNCTVDAYIWDLDSAANDYAIEVLGQNNVINTNIDEKYINIPFTLQRNTYLMRKFEKNGIKILNQRSRLEEALNSLSNENDLLLDCFNRDDVVFRYSNDLENYYVVTSSTHWSNIFFDGTNKYTSPTFEKCGFQFDFSEAKTIRGFAMWGNKLPDKIVLRALFTGKTEFEDVITLEAGVDYPKSSEPYVATWVFDYEKHSAMFGNFQGRNVEKLRVDMVNATNEMVAISRISAFDVEPVGIKYATKKIGKIDTALGELEKRVGDFDAALDALLAIQEELWGESV